MPGAVGEIHHQIVDSTARAELLEVEGRPIVPQHVIVRSALREFRRIGADGCPYSCAQGVVVSAAIRLRDLQLARAGAGDVPLVGMPPGVPVAEIPCAADEPTVAVPCPLQAKLTDAAKRRDIRNHPLHIRRCGVYRIWSRGARDIRGIPSLRHLASLAGLARLPQVIGVAAARLLAGRGAL